MKAYHFTNTTLRNGTPIPDFGEWLIHDGPIIACEIGLHASQHPLDALAFAPGPFLHWVELEGELAPHGSPVDKWAGRRRKIIDSIDATELVLTFSRLSALSAAHLWDAPDIVLEFLFTGDKSLREASWKASWKAAWDASWAAARAATRAAAWAATREASWAATRAATLAGAWEASREAARILFAELVNQAFAENK